MARQLLLWLVLAVGAVWAQRNPYQVLGVRSTASQKQVRKAYREKALKWHPDRTDDPRAEKVFREIADAYDVIGDEQKRAQYDRSRGRGNSYGRGRGSRWGGSEYHRYHSSNSDPESLSRRLTSGNFDYLVESTMGMGTDTLQVWLVYVHGSNCAVCKRVGSNWEAAAEKLQGIVHTGRVNADFEHSLVRQLGVRTLPTIFGVITQHSNSRKVFLRGTRPHKMTKTRILDFAAELLQTRTQLRMLTPGKDVARGGQKLRQNLERFFRDTEAPHAPRVRAMLLSRTNKAKALFAFLGTRLHKRVALAHVCVDCVEFIHTATEGFISRDALDVFLEGGQRAVLVMQKERGSQPVVLDADVLAEHSGSDRSLLLSLIERHAGLLLPELTDENMYDLCYKPRRRAASGQRTVIGGASCALWVADSHETAWAAAHELMQAPDSPLRAHLQWRDGHGGASGKDAGAGSINVAWVDSRAQPELAEALLGARGKKTGQAGSAAQLVVLRADRRQVLRLSSGREGHDKGTVTAWLEAVAANTAPTKTLQAGVPWPRGSSGDRIGLGQFFQQLLQGDAADDEDDTKASLVLGVKVALGLLFMLLPLVIHVL